MLGGVGDGETAEEETTAVCGLEVERGGMDGCDKKSEGQAEG